MSSAVERQHVFSFEEYAEISARSPERLEFWGGTILDMAGGSPRHSAICSNVNRLLGAALRGKPRRVFDANLRVRAVFAGRATYADATVVCGNLERDPADKTRHTVLNPTVLVEVLSPSTESDDRGAKLDSYKTMSSVRAVLLIAQDREEVTVHARQDDGSFTRSVFHTGSIRIDALGCELSITDIYESLPDE